MEQKVIGIYHSADLDGYSSGAIIKKKYPNAKLIGWDYGNPIPDLPDGAKVIMSDISFPMEKMYHIANKCDLTWIDHHISAIKACDEFFAPNVVAINFRAVLNSTISACELTWGELFPNDRLPESIRLLGTYDSWRNDNLEYWENKVMPFQYGMRLICNSPKNFPQELFWDISFVEAVTENGELIISYQKEQNELQCRKASFEIEWNGLKCICLNGGGFNSLVFGSVYDESKHDVMMPFQFNGKKWTISLYSTKDEIDCSEIAKTMGGGGHKGAAGFQVDDITKIIGE